jgi:phosphohistidine phosphatase SixA
MRIYLVRHATASHIASCDAERPLTKQGQREALAVGEGLARICRNPPAIYSSPKWRAVQTAQFIAQGLKSATEPRALDELADNSTTRALLKILPAGDVLLVGHMPGVARHLAELVGSKNVHAHEFHPATVACVEMAAMKPGSGTLLWKKDATDWATA